MPPSRGERTTTDPSSTPNAFTISGGMFMTQPRPVFSGDNTSLILSYSSAYAGMLLHFPQKAATCSGIKSLRNSYVCYTSYPYLVNRSSQRVVAARRDVGTDQRRSA